jgi:hypothetical protein
MALDPGVPNPPLTNLDHANPNSRHRRGEPLADRANPLRGGLHHEYFLAPTPLRVTEFLRTATLDWQRVPVDT